MNEEVIMYKKLITGLLILAASGLTLDASIKLPQTMHSLGAFLKEGLWFMVKPIDWVEDDGVTEFHPTGIKHISLEEMRDRIRTQWPSRQKKWFYINKERAQEKLAYIVNQGENIKSKDHILVFWYGIVCKTRRAEFRTLHYHPVIATGVKWGVLGALIVGGIAKARVYFTRPKESQEKDTPDESPLLIEKVAND